MSGRGISLPPPSYSEATTPVAPGSGVDSVLDRREDEDDVSLSEQDDIAQSQENRIADVDPAVALRLIAKGKATGNRPALWTRSVIQRNLFVLGKFIHRHAGKVLVAGLILLCVCCLGLRNIQFETRVEKLWIEEGGRLSSELEYIQKIHGSEAGASPLILLQTPDKSSNLSLLSPQALLLHLKAALVATQVEVEVFKKTWTLKDICHTVNFPNFDEIIPEISPALDQLWPCSIISPLDCFWEGAKLLGPENAVVIPGYNERLTWMNLDPENLTAGLEPRSVEGTEEILLDFVERPTYDVQPFISFLKKAGITNGYVRKPCLNPDDEECPDTAPNKKNRKIPDLSQVFSHGCTGISQKYMKWNEELLFGQIRKNKAQQIISASAMQTVFHISSATGLYESLKKHDKTTDIRVELTGIDWSEEAAASVIQIWQKKYSTEVEKVLRKEDGRETITVYSADNLQTIVASFSEFSAVRLAIGFSGMIVYVCFVLKRWSDPVNSYSGLGIAGTLLGTLCVAAGISLSAFLRTDFNALSTQIVPFLALGLNVFHVVQMIRTLSDLVDEGIPTEDLCGECLRQNGLNTIVSTLGLGAAFFAGYAIPIPALRTFAIQMGVLAVLSCPAMLILFPAVVALDQRRRSARRLDLFCCYGRPNPVPEVQYSQSAIVKIGGPRSRGLRGGCCTASTRPGRRISQGCTGTCHGKKQLGTCGRQPPKLGPLDQRLMESGMLSYGGYGPRDLTGSTNSIFRADPPTCCNDIQATCETVHVSQWFLRLFLRFVTNSWTKFFVVLIFCLVLAGSTWGMTHIEEGLDLTEFVPKNTPEHKYHDVSANSFGWYKMQIVTKNGIEFQNNQQILHEFHQAFQRLDHVVKQENGQLPAFWLSRMRDWLSELDNLLEKELASGAFTENDWHDNASSDAILAFKLRAQTGKDDYDRDQIRRIRLVDRRGIINAKAFYNYLSAWVGNDELAYGLTEASFHPEAEKFIHDQHDRNFRIPKSQPLDFAQFTFDLRGLQTTKQILKILSQVRIISETFQRQGIPNFPAGVVFSFWEQYVNLKFYLLVSLIVLLIAFFLVISIVLVNLWTAALIVLMTVVLLVEVVGLIGWLGIKLNAILAVILILSTGIGLKFTFRICMTFVMSIGCKNRRVRASLHSSVWPIIHGAAVMLIGLSMLAFSGFDFIFRYFFLVLTALVLLTAFNSLVFLPVLLSLVGPVADLIPNDDPERVPALTPEPPMTRPESRNCAAFCSKNLQKNGYRVGASTVSLSTISEEDSISCQQIFLEPQITVETTTSFPNGNSSFNASSDEKILNSGNSTSSFTTVVSTRAKVKVEVEVHRSGGSNTRSHQQLSDDCSCQG